jgi:hypothetical protein
MGLEFMLAVDLDKSVLCMVEKPEGCFGNARFGVNFMWAYCWLINLVVLLDG